MPINANQIIVGKKKEPVKAPRKVSSSIKAKNIVVINKPPKQEKKVVETTPTTQKYKTIENGDLIRKINTKSDYMRDVFNLDK